MTVLRALAISACLILSAQAHGQSVTVSGDANAELSNALQSLLDERTKTGTVDAQASEIRFCDTFGLKGITRPV